MQMLNGRANIYCNAETDLKGKDTKKAVYFTDFTLDTEGNFIKTQNTVYYN